MGTDGTPPRRFTAGPDDIAPRWSPTHRTLAFLRSADKKPPQLWVLPLDGGEPTRLTNVAKGASAAVWSPDGKRIASGQGGEVMFRALALRRPVVMVTFPSERGAAAAHRQRFDKHLLGKPIDLYDGP